MDEKETYIKYEIVRYATSHDHMILHNLLSKLHHMMHHNYSLRIMTNKIYLIFAKIMKSYV